MSNGWYNKIDEPTIGNEICDSIVHDSYIILIDGKISIRECKGIKHSIRLMRRSVLVVQMSVANGRRAREDQPPYFAHVAPQQRIIMSMGKSNLRIIHFLKPVKIQHDQSCCPIRMEALLNTKRSECSQVMVLCGFIIRCSMC